MSVKYRLRTLACCTILQMAAVIGVPMRPEKIQDLMRMLNEPKLASTNPDEDHRDDEPKTDKRAVQCR